MDRGYFKKWIQEKKYIKIKLSSTFKNTIIKFEYF